MVQGFDAISELGLCSSVFELHARKYFQQSDWINLSVLLCSVTSQWFHKTATETSRSPAKASHRARRNCPRNTTHKTPKRICLSHLHFDERTRRNWLRWSSSVIWSTENWYLIPIIKINWRFFFLVWLIALRSLSSLFRFPHLSLLLSLSCSLQLLFIFRSLLVQTLNGKISIRMAWLDLCLRLGMGKSVNSGSWQKQFKFWL